MTDNTERPKPASYGFELDFDDLSKTKPMPAPGAQKKPSVKIAAKVEHAKEKPRRKPKPKPDATDKLAKGMGFTSREQGSAPMVLKKRRRVHHNEPVDQLSIRGPVRVLNKFIEHCEANNLSYWEALDKLMD